MKNFIVGLIIVVAGVLLLYFLPNKTSQAPSTDQDNTQTTVVDFKTCVSAGYTILETFPAQCKTPTGVTYVESNETQPDAIITTPKVADVVTSPLVIKGKVRGSWFFEASIPIVLKDENGNILAQTAYHTSEDWMTSDYIDIDTTLHFKAPTTDYGVLIIQNDNPSGLPQNDKSVSIAVRFK